jgi:phage terminase small subunit
MAKKLGTKTLNAKQERFCQLYASDEEFFCNGVQSYIEAYNPKEVGNWYNSAKSSAFDLLTKPYILDRINELFEARGLNDAFVDKQLEKLITQDADFKSKVAAIKEYNALKKRIVQKMEVSTPPDRAFKISISTTDAAGKLGANAKTE